MRVIIKNSKNIKKIVLLVLAIIASFVAKDNIPQNASTNSSGKAGDYILTKHAKCRMGCRKIDNQDIQDILKNGKINHRKSDSNKRPCPIESFEGRASKDSQHIRVVAAKCSDVTKIVTVIDLGNKYNCHCD